MRDRNPGTVSLRATAVADLPTLIGMEADPASQHMAAFGGDDPGSPTAQRARWERMLGDERVALRTVLWDGRVVGYVTRFEMFQKPSVAYWILREFWGRGIATRALGAFLAEERLRPLYARVAKDNLASKKVLERCEFRVVGEDKGFARHRGSDLVEWIYELR
jgi:RimJ/RimL family protein N-acetyltransferase